MQKLSTKAMNNLTIKQPSRREFIGIIAALMALNSLAIYIMLPALPFMGNAFGITSENTQQYVISAYMFGYGLGEIIFGPLSDKLGRRKPLLLGVVIYVISTFFAIFSPTFWIILLLRFIQSVGAASTRVVATSVIRDKFSGHSMAEIMSLIMMLFMSIPILAPGIGQILLLIGSWQTIFLAMLIMGVIVGLWAFLILPETFLMENRRSLSKESILGGFKIVINNKTASAYGLAGMFLFASLLGFLNSAQQIYVEIYKLGNYFPIAFASVASLMGLSSFFNSRLVRIVGMRRLSHGAIAIIIVTSACLLTLSLHGMVNFWIFLPLLAIIMLHRWRGQLLQLSKVALICLPQMALASTVTIMQNEPPRSMDPGDQTATYTFNILDPMYEGLVRINADKQLVPALATAWTTDSTGKVWTFILRKDVKFHDGTPFDADAVVYNIHRHLDKSRGLAASGRMWTVIDSVTAEGTNKVIFHLKKTYPTFLNLLTSGAAMMVSPKADKAGTSSMQADGTGPYEFVQYKTGEFVLEKKNPHYWGTSHGADDLKWTWSDEMSVMNMAIQSGTADVINPVPPQFASVLKNNPNVSLQRSPGSSVFWVALDTKMKPLDDIRVRQALNLATDKNALVKAVSFNYAQPANSPLASIAPGYDSQLNDYPYNLDKAKTLLTQAGYPHGFSMSIAVQGQDARTAQVLQAMWKKIGVTLDVKQMESGVWTKAAFANPQEKEKMGISSVLASWSSGLLGNDNQLRPLYDSDSFAPGGANLGFYQNSQVDQLIDQASSTLDEQKRNALYDQLQKLISHDAAHVLLYYQDDLYATAKDVQGVQMIPGGTLVVRDAVKKAQ